MSFFFPIQNNTNNNITILALSIMGTLSSPASPQTPPIPKPRRLNKLTVTEEKRSNRNISKCAWKAIFKRQCISFNNFSYHIKESALEGQLHAGLLNRSLSHRLCRCFSCLLETALLKSCPVLQEHRTKVMANYVFLYVLLFVCFLFLQFAY